ncbi:MAG: DUF6503 family protein [Bacteroidota bacterium]
MRPVALLLISMLFLACSAKKDANEIIDEAILQAGGDLFENTEIEFVFRDREYGYKKVNGNFEYVRIFKDSAGVVRDVLTNTGFTRQIDGITTKVADTMATKYSNSVNSVVYFALLPYGLNDPAVNKTYVGQSTIKDEVYHKIKVTFNQEGGGEDFRDIFIYWIGKDDYKVDYLAYSYETDGGGIRFREAYNERIVNGVHFADYVNYKPKDVINLEALDVAFEKGNLEMLSKIELTAIKVNPL